MVSYLQILKVLILAGGAQPAQNYHSHKVHVDRLLLALEKQGVEAENISVFWADGHDEAPDRRIQRASDHRIPKSLQGHPWIRRFEGTQELVNTEFTGSIVYPARRSALKEWFSTEGAALKESDTLLIAVTDHGQRGKVSPGQSSISLWKEEWSADQMLEDLQSVPKSTRILLWMSQCYSGGFARLAWQRPNLCGAFSAEPTRMAYGCYPELAVKEHIGHFVRFTEGLGQTGSLHGANAWAIQHDQTPDTPHKSSDAYLKERMIERAKVGRTSLAMLIDSTLLKEASSDLWMPVAQLSERFGLGLINGYRELLRQLREVRKARVDLAAWRKRWDFMWRRARNSALTASGFVGKIKAEEPSNGQARLDGLLGWFARNTQWTQRLNPLFERVELSQGISDMLDLHEAALIRLSYLLLPLAGPKLLNDEEAETYAALVRCEQENIWTSDTPIKHSKARRIAPLFSEIQSQVANLRPSFLGVHYGDYGDKEGAIIKSVVPGSPAMAAGLLEGDIVLSVDGTPITQGVELAERTMISPRREPLVFQIQRGRQNLGLQVRLVGVQRPEPPLTIGSQVPSLPLAAYDSDVPLPVPGSGRPVIYFFWATWCGPCKKLVPILDGWRKKNQADVVSITVESKETIDTFLKKRPDWPFIVAFDHSKWVSRRFLATKYPTLVFVDDRGRFLSRTYGFQPTLAFPTLETREPTDDIP